MSGRSKGRPREFDSTPRVPPCPRGVPTRHWTSPPPWPILSASRSRVSAHGRFSCLRRYPDLLRIAFFSGGQPPSDGQSPSVCHKGSEIFRSCCSPSCLAPGCGPKPTTLKKSIPRFHISKTWSSSHAKVFGKISCAFLSAFFLSSMLVYLAASKCTSASRSAPASLAILAAD